MATVKFGSFSKRRNSTKQPSSLSDSRTVTLKEPTSQDRPVFICTGDDFDYNYCEWNGKYYFIDEIISLRNNMIEIHCIMDPLATYKSYITSSVQYVCYSSHNSNTWLPDMRIPLVKATSTKRKTVSMSGLFNTIGFYVLTAVGKNGCVAYAMDKSTLNTLLNNISSWQNNGINSATALINAWRGSDIVVSPAADTETAIADAANAITGVLLNAQKALADSLNTMGLAAVETGFIGNAYSQAPQCIRSCIWVPFFAASFVDTGAQLYLGNFDSGVHPYTLKADPVTGSVSVDIPWTYSDWRRGVCEDVYLYLPMVGMVQLSGSSLTNASSLTIKYSATATDGVVCYEVKADSNVIGTYSGQCSANYPIGINQQASAGEIAQSVIGGIDKTVSAAVNSSLSPVSMAASVGSAMFNAATGVYDVIDTVNTTHLTTIGGIGGGAGVGLDLNVQCFTVCHEPVMTPADMKDTMGLPTMLPMNLSTLTGFCQCANAHVEAPATAGELDAIDNYLNSGFFIE